MPTPKYTSNPSSPLKRCAMCGEEKPRTLDSFYFKKNTADQLEAWCKPCYAEYNRAYREKNKAQIREDKREYRQKNSDKIAAKKHADYWANPEYGRQKAREWYAANTDHARAYSAQYRAGEKTVSREHILANKRAYYVSHADTINARLREIRITDPAILLKEQAWRARNADKVVRYRDNRRRNRAANPERERARDRARYAQNPSRKRIENHNRTARKQTLPATLTQAEWQRCKQYWAYSCAYCGREEGFLWKLALEHVIPLAHSLCPGTVATNIVPACHGIGGCNNEKSNTDTFVWLTRKFGTRKAKQIFNKIAEYFRHISA